MAELRLTPQASADLEDITVFSIASFGEAIAGKYLGEFEALFGLLEKYPESGSTYAGIVPPVRSIKCGSHRIFYSVGEDVVTVIRILHFAQDAKRMLSQH